MKKIQIKKRKGKYRTIYVPSYSEKKELRKIKNELDWIYFREGVPDIVHGFIPTRSPYTNAIQHVGYRYSHSIDLADFFDGVHYFHVSKFISFYIQHKVFIDGKAAQGLPTSPTISNLAFLSIDRELERIAKEYNICITRYADDITTSFNDWDKIFKNCVIDKITGLCNGSRFNINADKTKTQDSKNGNRIITGVSVGNTGVKLRRKFVKNMRAAKHQGNTSSYEGLRNWMTAPILIPKITTDVNQQGEHIFIVSHGNITVSNKKLNVAVGLLKNRIKSEVMKCLH